MDKTNSIELILKEGSLKFLQTYPVILPVYTLVISLLLNNMQWLLFACWSLASLLSAPLWKFIFKGIYKLTGKKSLPLLGHGTRPSGAFDCWGFTYCSTCLADDIAYGMPSGHSLFAWMVSTYLILYLRKTEYDDKLEGPALSSFIPKVICLIILAFAVSSSRYIAGCHTIPQLIVGGLIGAGMGVMFYYVMKEVKIKGKNLFEKKKIYKQ